MGAGIRFGGICPRQACPANNMHNPAYNDNYAKTIGLCNYLKEEKGIARAEIIRKEDGRFHRLNVGDSMIQHDVMNMRNDEELNNLFR